MADMENQIHQLQGQLVQTLRIPPGGVSAAAAATGTAGEVGGLGGGVGGGVGGGSGPPPPSMMAMEGGGGIPDHFSLFVKRAIEEATSRIEGTLQQRIEEGLTVTKMQIENMGKDTRSSVDRSLIQCRQEVENKVNMADHNARSLHRQLSSEIHNVRSSLTQMQTNNNAQGSIQHMLETLKLTQERDEKHRRRVEAEIAQVQEHLSRVEQQQGFLTQDFEKEKERAKGAAMLLPQQGQAGGGGALSVNVQGQAEELEEKLKAVQLNFECQLELFKEKMHQKVEDHKADRFKRLESADGAWRGEFNTTDVDSQRQRIDSISELQAEHNRRVAQLQAQLQSMQHSVNSHQLDLQMLQEQEESRQAQRNSEHASLKHQMTQSIQDMHEAQSRRQQLQRDYEKEQQEMTRKFGQVTQELRKAKLEHERVYEDALRDREAKAAQISALQVRLLSAEEGWHKERERLSEAGVSRREILALHHTLEDVKVQLAETKDKHKATDMLLRNEVESERDRIRALQHRLQKSQEEERATDIALSSTSAKLDVEREQYQAEVQRLVRQIDTSKAVEMEQVKALEAQNGAIEKHRLEIEAEKKRLLELTAKHREASRALEGELTEARRDNEQLQSIVEDKTSNLRNLEDQAQDDAERVAHFKQLYGLRVLEAAQMSIGAGRLAEGSRKTVLQRAWLMWGRHADLEESKNTIVSMMNSMDKLEAQLEVQKTEIVAKEALLQGSQKEAATYRRSYGAALSCNVLAKWFPPESDEGRRASMQSSWMLWAKLTKEAELRQHSETMGEIERQLDAKSSEVQEMARQAELEKVEMAQQAELEKEEVARQVDLEKKAELDEKKILHLADLQQAELALEKSKDQQTALRKELEAAAVALERSNTQMEVKEALLEAELLKRDEELKECRGLLSKREEALREVRQTSGAQLLRMATMASGKSKDEMRMLKAWNQWVLKVKEEKPDSKVSTDAVIDMLSREQAVEMEHLLERYEEVQERVKSIALKIVQEDASAGDSHATEVQRLEADILALQNTPYHSGSGTADSSEPVTHIALDSGTGETKVLKFRQGADGSVEVTEMAKLNSLKGLFVGAVDSAAVADLTREIQSAVKSASPSHCFAGLTSWFRTADQAEQDAVGAFFRNSLPNFEVLKLSGHEEALKESIAVTFAAEKSGIGKPDTQVAAGGGSMQLVQGSEVYSLEQGFREGQSELMGTKSRRVVCEELEDRAFDRFAEFKEANPAFGVTAGIIVGISAAYYAAKGAKIDCSKGVRASEAHELFKDRKDELVANCSLQEARTPVSDKKVAQEIANVIIFCELFEQLIHPDSEIFFRRNWELDGVAFITTWSAGHFLQGSPAGGAGTGTASSKDGSAELEIESAIHRLMSVRHLKSQLTLLRDLSIESCQLDRKQLEKVSDSSKELKQLRSSIAGYRQQLMAVPLLKDRVVSLEAQLQELEEVNRDTTTAERLVDLEAQEAVYKTAADSIKTQVKVSTTQPDMNKHVLKSMPAPNYPTRYGFDGGHHNNPDRREPDGVQVCWANTRRCFCKSRVVDNTAFFFTVSATVPRTTSTTVPSLFRLRTDTASPFCSFRIRRAAFPCLGIQHQNEVACNSQVGLETNLYNVACLLYVRVCRKGVACW
jgi:hypothetical protein